MRLLPPFFSHLFDVTCELALLPYQPVFYHPADTLYFIDPAAAVKSIVARLRAFEAYHGFSWAPITAHFNKKMNTTFLDEAAFGTFVSKGHKRPDYVVPLVVRLLLDHPEMGERGACGGIGQGCDVAATCA